MKSFDVAIIGSGPAGASAAFELSKSGISTVIIEKEVLPRYKTCGGGLVYRGLKMMPFDISSAVEKSFYSMDIYFSKKEPRITTKREKPIATMVMRDSFDNLIVEKAQNNGVTLLQNHKVEDITFGDIQTIHTSNGEVTAKFIIAADGALSSTAKIAGWNETRTIVPALEYEVKVPEADFKRLSQSARFDIDAAPQGYGWCFPKKNHLSIGVAICVKNNKKINLKQYYADYLKTLGINEILHEEAHGFVVPVTPRTNGFVQKNVFLTGDAAGFADPLVAEGISNSILSGVQAAQAIIESHLNPEKAASLYLEKLEATILPEIEKAKVIAYHFYNKKTFRNIILKKYGQQAAESLTDLFMGERTYPKDYVKTITKKIKDSLF